MAKNFERLYLDVVNRIEHTRSDLLYIANLNKAVDHYLSTSDLGSLRDISETIKNLSGKNNDLRFTHPEIPWEVLIELAHISGSQNTLELKSKLHVALADLKKAINDVPDANGNTGELHQELKNRIVWQENVLTYLTAFTQAEYGLFHLQLDLQELYCGLVSAELNDDRYRAHEKIQASINLMLIENTISRYDALYQQINQTFIPGQQNSHHPNKKIFNDFNNVKQDLPDINVIKESNEKLRIAYENYQREWNDYSNKNTPAYKLDAVQNALIKCVENFIENQVLDARKKIAAHDLANNLDNSYWRVMEDEDNLENTNESTAQYDFSGLASVKKQLYNKQRDILADFALSFKNLCASKEPMTLSRRMAKLYHLIVIGETVKELCFILSPLSADEKKVLKKFITCRTALVHAADSPMSRQNLWELLELDAVGSAWQFLTKEKEDLIDQSLTSVLSLVDALEARFSGNKNSILNITTIDASGIESVKNELYKKDPVVTRPFLLRNLTTVEVLLEKTTFVLRNTNNHQEINAAMLTCIWLGQISKEINESSYAHSRTLLRHPEWKELAYKLKDASDLRAQFCHGFAANYTGNTQVQGQDQAMAMLFSFQKTCAASTLFEDSILSACEEKAFARDIARDLNFGVEVYPIYRQIMNDFLENTKRIHKAESAFNLNKPLKDNAAKITLKKAIKAYLNNMIGLCGVEKITAINQLKLDFDESPSSVSMTEKCDIDDLFVSTSLQNLACYVRDNFLFSAALEINQAANNSPTKKNRGYVITPEKADHNDLNVDFMAMNLTSNDGVTTPVIGSPLKLPSIVASPFSSPARSQLSKNSASLFAAFPDFSDTTETDPSFQSPANATKKMPEPISTGIRCGTKRTHDAFNDVATNIKRYTRNFFNKDGFENNISSDEYKALTLHALNEIENDEIKVMNQTMFQTTKKDKKRNDSTKDKPKPFPLFT